MASYSYTVMVIIMAGITVAAIITDGGEADIADGDCNYLRQKIRRTYGSGHKQRSSP